MATGYFGVPGSQRVKDQTKVHFVDGDDRPLCGARVRRGMEFQWCAGGFSWEYVECVNCQRAAQDVSPWRRR